MVWSEQIGVSIVVPSDRVQGDGRNYIVLGEDVPAEIADQMSAALVFRNAADPSPGTNGIVYWALGITKSGYLEAVAYLYSDVSAGSGFFAFYRRTIFSLQLPYTGFGTPFNFTIGSGGTYAEGPGVNTQTGNLYATRLRLPLSEDVSETSTQHAIQIGPDDGINTRFDNNEIMTLNAGVGTPTFFQYGIDSWSPLLAGFIGNDGSTRNKLDDTGWLNMTPNAPVAAGGDGMRYRRKNGICTFQIHCVYGGTWGGGFVVFTLPVGFRPSYVHWFTALWFGGTPFEFKVWNDGRMTVSANSGTPGGFIVSGAFACDGF